MSRGDAMQALNRLAREATLLLRVEVTALSQLLISKGIFTEQEWNDQLVAEADYYSTALEKRFPGFTATDIGMSMDGRAVETTKGWRP